MPSMKEIRTKIKSVENTRKITKAMEMVAASKMRRAQERMRAARPYAEKVRQIAAHMSQTNPEYHHPFMLQPKNAKHAGLILITTDKGLCGGMNTNILRATMAQFRELEKDNIQIETTAIGSKGLGFLSRFGAKVVSHVSQLGDTPHLDRLIGVIKVQFDAYAAGRLNAVYLGYTRFVNSMKQEAVIEQLLPLSEERLNNLAKDEKTEKSSVIKSQHGWDYVYEPDPQTVVDYLLERYVEALVYQAWTDNMASEQAARMVAMKAASDNANSVIDEMRLVYNKTRQAAITKELSEIVGGAAAI